MSEVYEVRRALPADPRRLAAPSTTLATFRTALEARGYLSRLSAAERDGVFILRVESRERLS
jgi:hypothetical protein